MRHAISYDLVGADEGEHNRMRNEVMAQIPDAKRILRTVWTVPTLDRTSQQIYDDVIERVQDAEIKADS